MDLRRVLTHIREEILIQRRAESALCRAARVRAASLDMSDPARQSCSSKTFSIWIKIIRRKVVKVRIIEDFWKKLRSLKEMTSWVLTIKNLWLKAQKQIRIHPKESILIKFQHQHSQSRRPSQSRWRESVTIRIEERRRLERVQAACRQGMFSQIMNLWN